MYVNARAALSDKDRGHHLARIMVGLQNMGDEHPVNVLISNTPIFISKKYTCNQ